MTKRLEARDNPKKVLEPEEDQGYASVLLVVGANKQPQKAQGYAEKAKSEDSLEREKGSYKRRPRKAPGPRKWSTGSCCLCLRGKKS